MATDNKLYAEDSERYVLGSLLSTGDTTSKDFLHRWFSLVGSPEAGDDVVTPARGLFTSDATKSIFDAIVTLVRRGHGAFTIETVYRELADIVRGVYVIISTADKQEVYDDTIILDQITLHGSGSRKTYESHVKDIKYHANKRKLHETARKIVNGIESGSYEFRDIADSVKELERLESQSRETKLYNAQASMTAVRSAQATGELLHTGYMGLDGIIGGYEQGRLYIVAARPGQGKTMFNINSAAAALESNAYVLFVSLEVGANELYSRLFSCMAFVDQKVVWEEALRYNKFPSDVIKKDPTMRGNDQIFGALKAEKAIANYEHLYIMSNDITDDMSFDAIVDSIRQVAEAAREARRPCIVFIDYIQLLLHTVDRKTMRGMNHAQIIGTISARLKSLAVRESVPIVTNAQLNRDASTSRPGVHQLRDSGSLEQDADVVILLDRPCTRDDGAASDIIDFIVGKSRATATGDVHMCWKPEKSAIVDFKPGDPANPNEARSHRNYQGNDHGLGDDGDSFEQM